LDLSAAGTSLATAGSAAAGVEDELPELPVVLAGVELLAPLVVVLLLLLLPQPAIAATQSAVTANARPLVRLRI
jgi:hypothetical protein